MGVHHDGVLVVFFIMALNIKNADVERLVTELAQLTGESKTETVRRSLLERKERLSFRVAAADRTARALRYLETELWPTIPENERGRRLTSEEQDAILGYGPDGA